MAQADVEQESTANATWSRMLQGNRRFAEGKPDHPWQDKETRQTLLDGQNPDAAVLACSDSRVPPEIIFDEGLGDLFTVRTAGQLIDRCRHRFVGVCGQEAACQSDLRVGP